ncbi:MAG: exostosin family protein [Leeuwenhoekiella sp.]
MKKLFLIQPKRLKDFEIEELPRISNLINKNPSINNFQLTTDLKEADIAVIFESTTFKTWKNIDDYKELVQFYLEKDVPLFCVNYEDGPPGFLPGFYTSLEKPKFNTAIYRSWPHLRLPNEKIEGIEHTNSINYQYLFSFAGSCSNPFRRILFDTFKSESSNYKVKEIDRWYNHSEDEKDSYVKDILSSYFVLCPKGIASYSHRIIETMALTRVPVIIADDWVPFSIEEDNYYIRVAEKDIYKLEAILEEKLVKYNTIKKNVSHVYNKYFKEDIRYSILLNHMVELAEEIDYKDKIEYLFKYWHSKEFFKLNKWLITQRIAGKLRKKLQL